MESQRNKLFEAKTPKFWLVGFVTMVLSIIRLFVIQHQLKYRVGL
jgi:hypothetical protein